jgi:5'-nucleotidase (lipoprotein e(P4) family)
MRLSIRSYIALTLLGTFCLLIPAAHSEEFTRKDLNEEAILALAWVQTAAEFKALAHQAFNIAKFRWDMDKQDGKKAVVVDLDETVIDNSPFNGGLIGKYFGYGRTKWMEWCFDESATDIPGAADFFNLVVKSGGDVFYLSNRKAQPEKKYDLTQVTMNNLKALGFPQVDKDHMLLRTGTSKKQPRRDIITEKGYRIVLLLGDNLNDFSSVFGAETIDERAAAVEMNKEKFGDIFIVLPNPIYGNWEAAVHGGGKWYKKSAKEQSDTRVETLRKFKFSE